ncbi:MAG: SDR family oxidoreductase [Bacteroidales bacterium]|jgi:NAD(P)-dependent dehydrogenase (short-subunit alcohol dehydrogenase family)|nr:SDR family oxidoreductase [Bacteroidales bacterium]
MNIVITGASSGIGRETALRLAGDPQNRVFVIARSEEALRSLAEECENRNIVAMPFDIAVPRSSLRELKNSLSADPGRIDILINNAGFLVNKPFELHTEEDIASTVAVNFTGPAALISELLPLFGRGSHVVNIGSMGGFQGSLKFTGLSWYSAAKGALAILTESLAAEYADRGISFNCLCPGSVQTEMLSTAFPGFTAPVSPAEMGAFVADFALNGNKFFNGKILPVALSVP